MRPIGKGMRFLDHATIPAKLIKALHSINISFMHLQSIEVKSVQKHKNFQVSQVYNPSIERYESC